MTNLATAYGAGNTPLQSVPVQGLGYSASFSVTPAAFAYSAGDVIGGAFEIENLAPGQGGRIVVVGTRLEVHHNALISGEAGYTLHLYSAEPPSDLADNAAWQYATADRGLYLGSITMGTPVDLGDTLFVRQDGLSQTVAVPEGGTVWAYLVTVGAFTATAAARVGFLETVLY